MPVLSEDSGNYSACFQTDFQQAELLVCVFHKEMDSNWS